MVKKRGKVVPLAQPSPTLQVMSPFLPIGLAQSQHFSGLSWGRVGPGWAEQTQPFPLEHPTAVQFWAPEYSSKAASGSQASVFEN